jgi:hypothetical protein
VCFNCHNIWYEHMVCPYCQESTITTIQKDISGQANQEEEFDKRYDDIHGQCDEDTPDEEENDNMKRRGVDPIIQQMMHAMTNNHTDTMKQDTSELDVDKVYVLQEKTSLIQTMINRSTWLLDSGATVFMLLTMQCCCETGKRPKNSSK